MSQLHTGSGLMLQLHQPGLSTELQRQSSDTEPNSPLVCLGPEIASVFLALPPASFSSLLSPSSLLSSASS